MYSSKLLNLYDTTMIESENKNFAKELYNIPRVGKKMKTEYNAPSKAPIKSRHRASFRLAQGTHQGEPRDRRLGSCRGR